MAIVATSWHYLCIRHVPDSRLETAHNSSNYDALQWRHGVTPIAIMYHVRFTHLPTGQAFWNQLYITQSQIMDNGWINLQICLQTCQNSLSVSASASQDQRPQEKVSCQSTAYRGQQKRKECVSDNVLHKYEVVSPYQYPSFARQPLPSALRLLRNRGGKGLAHETTGTLCANTHAWLVQSVTSRQTHWIIHSTYVGLKPYRAPTTEHGWLYKVVIVAHDLKPTMYA